MAQSGGTGILSVPTRSDEKKTMAEALKTLLLLPIGARSRALALAAGVCSLLLALAPASGQEPARLIVLDATAQMGAKLGAKRKLDWAKTLVPPHIRRLGVSSSSALWAFGAGPIAKCDDSRELAPLAKDNAADTERALAGLEPKAGRAPAMATVKAALKSLGREDAAAHIIVITGTGDDCGADICASARALKVIYPKARLTVLGLGLAPDAAEDFSCAAKAMDGRFVAIKSGPELERALQQHLPAQGNGGKVSAAAPTTAPAGGKGKGDRKLAATDAQSGVKSDGAQATSDKTEPSLVNGKKPDEAGAEKTAANKENKEAPEAEPKETAAPVTLPLTPVPVTETNVTLQAALSADSPPLNAGVTWKIARISANGESQLTMPVWAGAGGPAKAKLSEGRYRAEASYGLARAETVFELGKDKIEKSLSLEAGMVSGEAFIAPKNEQRLEDAFFALYKALPGGGRQEIARSSALPAVFNVNAGDYILKASSNFAELETPITVYAGKVTKVKMALNLGTLRVKAELPKDIDPDVAVRHAIFHLKEPAPAAPIHVAAGSEATVMLPAGDYRLVTTIEGIKLVSEVTVKAGEVLTKTVTADVGEAKITAKPQNGAESAAGNGILGVLSCALFSGSGPGAEPVAREAGPRVRFLASQGDYDVECRGVDAAKAAPSRQKIRIISGQSQTVEIIP